MIKVMRTVDDGWHQLPGAPGWTFGRSCLRPARIAEEEIFHQVFVELDFVINWKIISFLVRNSTDNPSIYRLLAIANPLLAFPFPMVIIVCCVNGNPTQESNLRAGWLVFLLRQVPPLIDWRWQHPRYRCLVVEFAISAKAQTVFLESPMQWRNRNARVLLAISHFLWCKICFKSTQLWCQCCQNKSSPAIWGPPIFCVCGPSSMI